MGDCMHELSILNVILKRTTYVILKGALNVSY